MFSVQCSVGDYDNGVHTEEFVGMGFLDESFEGLCRNRARPGVQAGDEGVGGGAARA